MTPQQIQAAEAVSKLRVLKYKNDPQNDLIGALGEVAVSAWAVVSGIHPVDDAFKDPSRDSGADLYLGSKNVSVDVKSSSAGDIYTYPEKQISTLKAKASAVIWCAVFPLTEGWDVVGYEVSIFGWSSANDVLKAPLISPDGRDPYRAVSSPVRDLPDLIATAR